MGSTMSNCWCKAKMVTRNYPQKGTKVLRRLTHCEDKAEHTLSGASFDVLDTDKLKSLTTKEFQEKC